MFYEGFGAQMEFNGVHKTTKRDSFGCLNVVDYEKNPKPGMSGVYYYSKAKHWPFRRRMAKSNEIPKKAVTGKV